jgi:hypothetical protein
MANGFPAPGRRRSPTIAFASLLLFLSAGLSAAQTPRTLWKFPVIFLKGIGRTSSQCVGGSGMGDSLRSPSLATLIQPTIEKTKLI